MKRLAVKSPWNEDAAMRLAIAALEAPPTRPWIERVAPVGDLMIRFVLPLELCPPTNRTRHGQGWQLAKIKKRAHALMLAQAIRRMGPAIFTSGCPPLPGRPLVRCIRFSAVAPDALANFAKIPVDILCARTARAKARLSIIRDDKPSAAKVVEWWEPAPKGSGCVLVEVWTGDAMKARRR